MSVAYQELLKRQALEREEFLDRERRENTTVTFQHSTNKERVQGPFTIEIVFPDNLKFPEKMDIARELTTAASQVLEARGYKIGWLPPKDEVPAGNCTT